jgi:N-acetylmuramic acid 6-phosphate etherase
MLRLGRIYRGMMVNMQPTNTKLKRRAETMVAQIAQCDPPRAARSLDEAEGDIKTAVLLALGVPRADADAILKNCDGNLRRVFVELASNRDGKPRGVAPRPQRGAAKP